MNTRPLLVSAGVAALIIAGYAWYVRDLPVYASADAPLAAPIDSVCLDSVLARRYGHADAPPIARSGTKTRSAVRWLHYGHAIFRLTYSDSGFATLSSAKPIDSGFVAALLPSRTVMDSVGRQLGAEVLAARDACGGRARPGLPELTIGR